MKKDVERKAKRTRKPVMLYMPPLLVEELRAAYAEANATAKYGIKWQEYLCELLCIGMEADNIARASAKGGTE